MKRKKINFKYLLLIPAFFIGINSFAQQKQAPEKVSAKEITTNKVVAPQQAVKSDVPVQKADINSAIISNSKEQAASAGRTTSTTPGITSTKSAKSTSSSARATEKYDRELISNKKPANYDADKKKAPTVSDTKPATK